MPSPDPGAVLDSDRLPPLFQSILTPPYPAWVAIGVFPTAVEPLTFLEEYLRAKNIWVKRDDLSAEIYGGNKVRSLEFCLATALKKQADVTLSYSALGSNWPLACTIYSRLFGLESEVFFMPYPMDSIKQKNLALTEKLARRIFAARFLATFPFILGSRLFVARRKERVYLTPPGGISPTTTLGYVNAVLELKAQCESGECPRPDYIFCPFGSGGTAAGISIGLNLIGWPTRVIAVRVVDLPVANKFTLRHLIRRTVKLIRRRGANVRENQNWYDNISIEHRYFGKGYGHALPQAGEYINLFARQRRHCLDATYTGKTVTALADFVRQQKLGKETILFWQTLNSRPLESVENMLAKEQVPRAG